MNSSFLKVWEQYVLLGLDIFVRLLLFSLTNNAFLKNLTLYHQSFSNLHYTVFINKDDKNLETFPAVMGDFQDKRFKFEKKHSLAVSLLTKQERELPWRSAYTKIVLRVQCERQPQSSGRRFKPRHIKRLNESCMHDVTVWSCQVLHRGILK